MLRLHTAWLPVLLLVCACARPPQPPERINHEERALAKANAAWAKIYTQRADETFSPQNIQRFAPYTATLENGVWIVRGAERADVHGQMPSARVRADDGDISVQSIAR